MLNDIKTAREESQDDRGAAKAILRRAKSWEQELREKTQAIEDARQTILNEARAEARRELEETRRQLRRLSKEITSDAFPDGAEARRPGGQRAAVAECAA